MTFRESLRKILKEKGIPAEVWNEAERQAEESLKSQGRSLDEDMPDGEFHVAEGMPTDQIMPIIAASYTIGFVDGLQHGVKHNSITKAAEEMWGSPMFKLPGSVHEALTIVSALADHWPEDSTENWHKGLDDNEETRKDTSRILLTFSITRLFGHHPGGEHGKN